MRRGRQMMDGGVRGGRRGRRGRGRRGREGGRSRGVLRRRRLAAVRRRGGRGRQEPGQGGLRVLPLHGLLPLPAALRGLPGLPVPRARGLLPQGAGLPGQQAVDADGAGRRHVVVAVRVVVAGRHAEDEASVFLLPASLLQLLHLPLLLRFLQQPHKPGA